MKKPIIGITSAYEKEEGLRNYHRSIVSIDYSKAIIASGGIPIILPVTNNEDIIKSHIELLDGLILSGGADVNPLLYGEDFQEKNGIISPERDIYELLLLKYFTKTNKPILGVCRGMQILNVFFKGSLYQDLSYCNNTKLKHTQELYPELEVHKVLLKENSYLSKVFGPSIMTNSFHHQSIKDLGKGFEITGETSDGIIEAIESKENCFYMGVQWHPEMMIARGNKNMKKVFDLFIEKAKY